MILKDKDLSDIATIDNITDCSITEGINQEYTLSFTAIVGDAPFINNIVEINDDYFNVVRYRSYRDGPAPMCQVDCEHVSYDLNSADDALEYFTMEGTPAEILAGILQDTDFTVGTVELTDTVVFSIQEKMTRRAILIYFAQYIGAEIKYSKYTVSLLQRRGAETGVQFVIGKNITGIEKVVDARGGDLKVSYDVKVVELSTLPEFGALEKFELGDTVTIIDSELGINVAVRIVKYAYNPLQKINSELQIQNFTESIADSLYRIQTSTLIKDKLYNGTRIGPEYGFEAVRSDKKARTYFNSTNMAMQTGDGSGNTWINKLYIDIDPETGAATLVFDGILSADAIEAIKANIDVVVSNTIITQTLAAGSATIAELTVDQLNTGSAKIRNYLNGDTSDIHYKRDYEQYSQYITASTNGSETEQAVDRNGNPLYWTDDTHTGTTLDETEYPVLMYVYEESTKLEISFDASDPNKVPKIVLGVGAGVSGHPDWGKGFIWKDETGLVMQYITEAGNVQTIKNGEDGIIVSGSTGERGLRNITVSGTPPSNPGPNELWIDTGG